MSNESYTQDNFIGIYKDVFEEGYCEHLISEFNRLKGEGAGFDRNNGEGAPSHVKNDYSMGLNIKSHTAIPFNGADTADIFLTVFKRVINDTLANIRFFLAKE